jgi:hypothetical protein
MIGDAIVGWLQGDAHARAQIAPIARIVDDRTRSLRFVRADCWYAYEQELGGAWNDYASCFAGASGLFATWIQDACGAEWTIRVEGYWFEYLGCSTIPLRAA